MQNRTSAPRYAETMDWIPLDPGVSFRPLRFGKKGRALQLRVEPGITIPRHRHTGWVQAVNVSGSRELIETGEIARAGAYVYEPPGNVDSWRCIGEEACVVQIAMTGRVEYLDEKDEILTYTDTPKLYEIYRAWCAQEGVTPVLQLESIG